MSTNLILTKLGGSEDIITSTVNNPTGILAIQGEVATRIAADKVTVDAGYAGMPGYSSVILYNNNNMDACIKISIDSTLSSNGFTVPRVQEMLVNFYLTKEIPAL